MFCVYYGNVVAERKVREHKNGMHNVYTYHREKCIQQYVLIQQKTQLCSFLLFMSEMSSVFLFLQKLSDYLYAMFCGWLVWDHISKLLYTVTAQKTFCCYCSGHRIQTELPPPHYCTLIISHKKTTSLVCCSWRAAKESNNKVWYLLG